ncbi:MAG: phosphoribosylamine--glycine ligase [Bacteroidia bacterium]
MNVLLLGSGGREHAIAWKIAQSPLLKQLFIAPGNAGTAACGTNLDIDILDFELLKEHVLERKINLVIVGPEEPLVKGVYNFFSADKELSHIPVIGPSARAAALEGSKDFAKKFMAKYNIPTARYNTFTKETIEEGVAFLRTLRPPHVLKADGLAAGKGVIIPMTTSSAENSFKEMLLEEKFGPASKKVLIEEFLIGTELSIFVLTDGNSFHILPEAKDYKRIGENDTGLNTGGMGAISPVPFADSKFMEKVKQRIIIPTIEGLKKEKLDYKGFIFFGLINCQGNPFVIEYNARMGDPETEVVIPRIKSDLLLLMVAVANQTLYKTTLEIDERPAATVMMVSGGYPEAYEKGKEITGLDKVTDSIVFHAGTKASGVKVLTNGGRVLAVTSMKKTLAEAVATSYESIGKIDYEKKYYRHDIGRDVLG